MVKIGIIGGSGLDNPDILKDAKEINVETPYGPPTSSLTCGVIEELMLLSLPVMAGTIPFILQL